MERVSRDEGNFSFDRELEHISSVYLRRECHPQEEAALRVYAAHSGWGISLQRFQHRVAAFLVDLTYVPNVVIQKTAPRNFISHHLVEGCRVKVSALLRLHESINYW